MSIQEYRKRMGAMLPPMRAEEALERDGDDNDEDDVVSPADREAIHKFLLERAQARAAASERLQRNVAVTNAQQGVPDARK